MNTIASDPGVPGEPPRPRSTYSPYLLLHHTTLKLLEAEGCKGVTVTSDNVGLLVRAARAMLKAFNVEPDMGDPEPGEEPPGTAGGAL